MEVLLKVITNYAIEIGARENLLGKLIARCRASLADRKMKDSDSDKDTP